MSYYSTHMNLTNIEHTRNFSLAVLICLVQCSYSVNVRLAELAVWIPFALTLHDSFFERIARVLLRSTSPQMFWIHAKWHVTGMTYKQAVRDLPLVKFVRKSMGAWLVPDFYKKITVTPTGFASLPQPTPIVLFNNKTHKAFNGSLPFTLIPRALILFIRHTVHGTMYYTYKATI